MSIRVSTLVLMVSLAMATGCPGGDGDGDGTDEDGGNAGAGGASGGGSGASGGGSGTSGMGSSSAGGGGSGLTAEQAASGMCGMSSDTNCTGLDAYQSCLESECMIDQCYEGPCASYLQCLQSADDPCDANDECPLPAECQDCFVGKATCFSGCIGELECDGMQVGGDSMAGGACDQLDTCCASLDDAANKAQCEQIAGIIRIGGDMACEGPLMTYCP